MENLIVRLTGAVPAWVIYLVLFGSSALENILPPFPGDTMTVLGAYIAGRGYLDPVVVLLVTAAGNLSSNLVLYRIGYRKGRAFILQHRRLFHPDLVPRVALFYRRWGLGALFFSRFLVGLRSIVPLFAGVSRVGIIRFLAPVTLSIAVQHSLLVLLGYKVGRSWEYIKTLLREINIGLAVVAVAAVVAIIIWYRRVRRSRKRREWIKRNRSSILSNGNGEVEDEQ